MRVYRADDGRYVYRRTRDSDERLYNHNGEEVESLASYYSPADRQMMARRYMERDRRRLQEGLAREGVVKGVIALVAHLVGRAPRWVEP